jgi:hypothetical protein
MAQKRTMGDGKHLSGDSAARDPSNSFQVGIDNGHALRERVSPGFGMEVKASQIEGD